MREIGFTVFYSLGLITFTGIGFVAWFGVPHIRGKVLYSFGTAFGCVALSIGLSVPLNLNPITLISLASVIVFPMWVLYLIYLTFVVFRVKSLNAVSVKLKQEGKTYEAIKKADKALYHAIRTFLHNTEYWKKLDWSHIKEDLDETVWKMYFSDDILERGWTFPWQKTGTKSNR